MNYSETSREMDEWEKFEEIEVRSLGAGVTNIGDVTTNRGGRTWNGDVNKECKVKHRCNFWFYNPPPHRNFPRQIDITQCYVKGIDRSSWREINPDSGNATLKKTHAL